MAPDTQIKEEQVTKIWTSNRTLEQQCREQYPAAELISSKDQLVEDQSISLVVLCNPGPEDRTLIGRLVKANKSVRVLHV
jgi:predicted dehydrogenase